MSYRLRISDELYQRLHIKACEAGVSIEMLTEKYILDAIQPGDDAKSSDRSAPRLWDRPRPIDEHALRLVRS